MKTFNGIMMVAITALFGIFYGCSQDDDMYDNSDMYTLAEEMGTRGGGGDPGGGVQKKKVVFKLTNALVHNPKKKSDITDPILDGEYDTDTLTVSISNFVGHAAISIHSGESRSQMSSDTIAIPEESPVNFPLSGYATGVNYEINVVLSDSSAYVGLFDL